MARYDVEKRCAIEKEDYDLAKKKKELMEEYRKSVYQQLEVHNLLDMAMVSHQPLIAMRHLCSNSRGTVSEMEKIYFCPSVGVKQDEKLWDMEKNHKLFCLN